MRGNNQKPIAGALDVLDAKPWAAGRGRTVPDDDATQGRMRLVGEGTMGPVWHRAHDAVSFDDACRWLDLRMSAAAGEKG